MRSLTILFILFSSLPLFAQGTFWVDNVYGNDLNPGSKEAPFRSVEKAIELLKPGVTLHLVPNGEPYKKNIMIKVDGTPEKRITIDGHGSLISGMQRVAGAAFKDEGGGVFSMPFRNNAWVMKHFWEGGFDLVRFDGTAGANKKTKDDLVPFSYFLYKNQEQHASDPLHNTLYICLPEGNTPDGVEVETLVWENAIDVQGDYITVRNFKVEYGRRDGFSTSRIIGAVFENIEARFFMDQGMSHHGSQAVVKNAHFHHNAGCGVVDVYPECVTRYEYCIIENAAWRGGVEFYKGKFTMINCTIRNNPFSTLKVSKGAQVNLINCELIIPSDGGGSGITVGENSSLYMDGCKIIRQ